MKNVFVKGTVLAKPDRADDVLVEFRTTPGAKKAISVSVYDVTSDKPCTEFILRVLGQECDRMTSETEDFEKKALVVEIFKKAADIVKAYQ